MSETRAWRTVLEHVEQRLRDGSLGPGDRLPGERDLASQLGVGRSSVREALRVLEVMGVLHTATGSGPRAGAVITVQAGSGLAQVLGLQAAAQAFRFDDVVATRLVLETAVAEALAGARPDLAGAGEVLDAMDAPDLARDEFLALDARFHALLAEATGNAVFGAIMTGLRAAIEAYVQHGAHTIADWGAARDRLQREHRGVVDAIDRGDAPGARARIHDHIRDYHALTRAT
ncbi:FadR/GntR family transcriptional regulator [Microbacterium sp. ZXX196]|uniref:FadR/GntR family transcriptional regulator n=1 Tax=Microbacterium sp. ZXX196 TaxID=2609291 RepID=UPI0012B7D8C5|nr:FCD domain-containing protein [Microbacterium sp. ZXX196]MTE22639.1 FCD domain-containing protein [Microbacterium sp. ZXX196]